MPPKASEIMIIRHAEKPAWQVGGVTVLIAWQHEGISVIANSIRSAKIAPQSGLATASIWFSCLPLIPWTARSASGK